VYQSCRTIPCGVIKFAGEPLLEAFIGRMVRFLPLLVVLLKYSELAKVWINALANDDVDLPANLPCNQMHEGIKRKH
jgi:hypothetical protein